jgi:hypothetical protein
MVEDVTEDVVLTTDLDFISEVDDKDIEESKYRIIGRKNSLILDKLLINAEPLA